MATTSKTKSGTSRPVITREVTLSSTQSQRVFQRVFSTLSSSLLSISIVTRIVGNEEHAAEAEGIVDGWLEQTQQDMTKERARLDLVLEQNGIFERPTYSSPSKVQVEISSPRASRFLNLLSDLDQLMSSLDAMWFGGLLKDKEKVDGSYAWQRRLIKLAGRVRNQANTLKAKAKAHGHAIDEDAEPDLDSAAEAMLNASEPERAEGEATAPTPDPVAPEAGPSPEAEPETPRRTRKKAASAS